MCWNNQPKTIREEWGWNRKRKDENLPTINSHTTWTFKVHILRRNKIPEQTSEQQQETSIEICTYIIEINTDCIKKIVPFSKRTKPLDSNMTGGVIKMF